MKKSLVILVVLGVSLALSGTVFASDCWDCNPIVDKPAPCKDQVLCKGKAAGLEKMCGPCAPTIKWSGSWMTALKCPAPAAAAKAAPATKGKGVVKKDKKK